MQQYKPGGGRSLWIGLASSDGRESVAADLHAPAALPVSSKFPGKPVGTSAIHATNRIYRILSRRYAVPLSCVARPRTSLAGMRIRRHLLPSKSPVVHHRAPYHQATAVRTSMDWIRQRGNRMSVCRFHNGHQHRRFELSVTLLDDGRAFVAVPWTLFVPSRR